jgi:hypothetical protein
VSKVDSLIDKGASAENYWRTVQVPNEALLPKALPVIERATPDMAGCWIDGARGWRAVPYAVRIAHRYGWPLSAHDGSILDRYESGDQQETGPYDHESVSEMCNDATEWLSQNVAPLGYRFEWHDGDLMLWSEAASCAVSGDTCQCTTPHDENGEPVTVA